jgi:simple sugar transport system ATP-binding protein
MFGIDHKQQDPALVPHRMFPEAVPRGSAEPILSVQGLSVEAPGRPFIRNIDLELAPGTITGIAGVRDSGLETLELALTGFLAPAGGTIRINGRNLAGVKTFREAGGAYLSADRTGFAPDLPLQDSIIIHAHQRACRGFWGKFGVMDQKFLDSLAGRIMHQAQVTGSFKTRGASFSGGMLQRIMLSREFAENAPLLILAEPGWGLDGRSRERLAGKLSNYVAPGRAALLFSTDVEELIAVSDLILVLRNGTFSARIPLDSREQGAARMDTYKARIGKAMTGGFKEAVHG